MNLLMYKPHVYSLSYGVINGLIGFRPLSQYCIGAAKLHPCNFYVVMSTLHVLLNTVDTGIRPTPALYDIPLTILKIFISIFKKWVATLL